jgi:excisionase family DNA binding protein
MAKRRDDKVQEPPPPPISGVDWSRKTVFTTGEAAEVCNVSQQTIIRSFDAGRLSGFKVPGSKFRRIPREELVRFMRANGMPLEAIAARSTRVLAICDGSLGADLRRTLDGADGLDLTICEDSFEGGLLCERLRPACVVLDALVLGDRLAHACRACRESEGSEGVLLLVVRSEPVAGADGAIRDAEAEQVVRWLDRTIGIARPADAVGNAREQR